MDLKEIFSYHSPTGDQPQRYQAIRSKALELAEVIVANTPVCADQTAAIRHLREAVMTANAAIALENSAVAQGDSSSSAPVPLDINPGGNPGSGGH